MVGTDKNPMGQSKIFFLQVSANFFFLHTTVQYRKKNSTVVWEKKSFLFCHWILPATAISTIDCFLLDSWYHVPPPPLRNTVPTKKKSANTCYHITEIGYLIFAIFQAVVPPGCGRVEKKQQSITLILSKWLTISLSPIIREPDIWSKSSFYQEVLGR